MALAMGELTFDAIEPRPTLLHIQNCFDVLGDAIAPTKTE